MTSIERTAYPLLRRLVSARELHVFYTPTADEARWAREKTRSEERFLALVLALKCFQRLARFPGPDELADDAVEHVRRCLGVDGVIDPAYGAGRTERAHRELVRARVGVIHDPDRARAVAEAAIRAAAEVKNNPADLINVALEELVRGGYELPAFRTLDDMASRIRLEVNRLIFDQILTRMSRVDRERIERLLEVVWPAHTSAFNRLKKAAKRASWSQFKAQLEHLRWVDSLGDTDAWFDGIAPSKIADFAGEASAGDAAVLRDYAPDKRTALLACLVHSARARARDDVAEMFCKRVARMTTQARNALDEIREHQRAITERLIANYRDVLEALDPDAPSSARETLALVRRTVESAGGFQGELADIEAVSAHHGDNHQLLVERFFRRDRAQMFATAVALQLQATSADRSVLDALEHAVAHAHLTRDLISDHLDGRRVDLSFASENWRQAILSRKHPGRLVRRHFEACVFTYLAEELRTGDIAVAGSDSYANWAEHLLSWEECEPLLDGFCVEVGLPADAAAFTAALRTRLEQTAAQTDAGYPDNADLVIDEQGVATLKRRRGKERRDSAIALEEQIKQRMPERSLLGILARTAHWLGWWRRFGPASGNDPKLIDPIGRYILTTFTYATNLGPYQAARHINGVSAHELGSTANRHVTIDKLNKATADVVNAYMQLDLVKAWGDGASAAADGTQIDTFIENLVAETSIRYGGYGGIAYHHIADTYIALFSHFIPCGVWEAVYIIEGLLRNESNVHPDTIHADTQGQSFPVFGLAHLLGFELMPRIRNWKDLIFHRASEHARYTHIDSLFGDPGRNAIDWTLIQTHWTDLMQVALSIREGKLSSVLLLRRLGSNSRKNSIYKAFRELGRVIRTIQMLRYISDPMLRERVTAATNKVEAYNGYTGWLRFGNAGVIADNDPAEQEKTIKFNQLLANCAIFHTTLDMTTAIRDLQADGWSVTTDDLAVISPYLTETIKRFGDYPTDELSISPDAFDSHLELRTERDQPT